RGPPSVRPRCRWRSCPAVWRGRRGSRRSSPRGRRAGGRGSWRGRWWPARPGPRCRSGGWCRSGCRRRRRGASRRGGERGSVARWSSAFSLRLRPIFNGRPDSTAPWRRRQRFGGGTGRVRGSMGERAVRGATGQGRVGQGRGRGQLYQASQRSMAPRVARQAASSMERSIGTRPERRVVRRAVAASTDTATYLRLKRSRTAAPSRDKAVPAPAPETARRTARAPARARPAGVSTSVASPARGPAARRGRERQGRTVPARGRVDLGGLAGQGLADPEELDAAGDLVAGAADLEGGEDEEAAVPRGRHLGFLGGRLGGRPAGAGCRGGCRFSGACGSGGLGG